MLRAIFILCVALLAAGCAEHRRTSIAHVTRTAEGRYETKLDSVEWVAGGPCNFPGFPHRSFGECWIYTDTTNGLISADHITLAFGVDWESFRATYDKEPLKGSVLFSNGQVRVSIMRPAYPDGVQLKYYYKFPLNGTYTLKSE